MNSRKNPVKLFRAPKTSSTDVPMVAQDLQRGMAVRTTDGTIRTVFEVYGSIHAGKMRIKFDNDTFTSTCFASGHIFYVAM
jgi:hypothetical protein